MLIMWLYKRYKESFYQSKGGILVTVWIGMVLQSTIMIAFSTFFILEETHEKIIDYSIVSCIYLLYPVFGYLGERISRHKVLLCGSGITLTGYAINLALIFALDIKTEWINERHSVILVSRYVANFCGFLGYGICYSNFLQFGITQLEFASSTTIRAYVRWFTFTSFSTGILPQLLALLFTSLDHILIINAVYLMIMIITLSIVYTMRGSIIMESLSRVDAVTLIYRVLKYAWAHNSPVRPSAYSYSHGPATRLDFAKTVFGGPFTTQQVEDVKSFWYLLLIPLCHIFSPGMFIPSSLGILYIRCVGGVSDTIEKIMLYCTIPAVLIVTVGLVGLVQLVIVPWCSRWSRSPKLITRMWVALLLYLLSAVVSLVLGYQIISQLVTIEIPYTNTSIHICEPGSSNIWPYQVILVPVILSGLGLGLSVVSQLEFIMAQAPHTMKGILVGVTYLQFVTPYLASFVSSVTIIGTSLYFYASITALQLIILVIYSIVAKFYKYRQQNDEPTVNLRDNIVHIFETELMRREKEEAARMNRSSIYSDSSNTYSSISE